MPGAGGKGNEESLLTVCRVSVWESEEVLEMASGDGACAAV